MWYRVRPITQPSNLHCDAKDPLAGSYLFVPRGRPRQMRKPSRESE